MLRFLHKQAKEEMAQQELRKKLAAVDAEVAASLWPIGLLLTLQRVLVKVAMIGWNEVPVTEKPWLKFLHLKPEMEKT